MEGKAGAIRLHTGPMFAGKTSALLEEAAAAAAAGADVLLVHWRGNTRTPRVEAHDGRTLKDRKRQGGAGGIRTEVVGGLGEVGEPPEGEVFVDEGQFFADLAPEAARLAAGGRRVTVAALNGDWRRAPFPPISALFAACDSVVHHLAACAACGGAAAHSRRRGPAGGGSQIEVGGAELYEPACRACFEGPGGPRGPGGAGGAGGARPPRA
jgi:thymidine kinase